MTYRAVLVTATALSLAGFATAPAIAQEADGDSSTEQGDRIVVTGSRIQRQDFVAPSPIVTVTADDYADSGRVAVDDYLRELPQFTAGTGDYSNDSNGGTAGRATLNLRGLGPQRNLVILDGRRLMSSGTDGAIDINTIPSLAIGGIEIISGGASATYGSDALSGVVNFKTRTDLDGFDVRAQYTALDQPGEDSYLIGGAFGTDFAGGAGNLLLSAEYSDRGGVAVNQRDFFLNPNASSFIPQGRSRIGNAFLGVNDDGTIFNQGNGSGYNGPTTLPFLINSTGGIGYHGSYNNLLQVPLERISLFGKLDYEVSPGTNLYLQGLYTDSTASNIGAAPNIAGAPWSVTIPGTNPFLVAVRAANPGQFGANGSPINVFQTRLSQFGDRIYETGNETFQFLVGANGNFGSSDISWDVHASYGKATNEDRTVSGSASVSALQQLLNAPDGGNSLCSGGYNPFGGQTPLSPACIDFVERTPLNLTTLEQYVIEGNVEGPLFELPAGGARFALTAQYRKNDYGFVPDTDLATGDLANLSITLPTTGSIDAIELGGELFLPVIASDSFLQELNLTLGYRFADYNLAGSNSTYKAELDAHLFDDVVLLRGGYQRAVRAPNVGEFFLAGETRVVGVGVPPGGGDPCDFRNAPAGDALALCAFQGIPLRPDGSSNYRAATASLPATTRGNPNLTPETADTFTAGIVLDVPLGGTSLRLSSDYYNIKIADAIGPVSAADSLQRCFNGLNGATAGFDAASYNASNFFCQNFDRDAGTGDPANIVQPIINLGSLETSGIDFAANLDIPVGFFGWGGREGSIVFNANWNYLLSYKVETFANDPIFDYAGSISANAQESLPEWRGLTSLTVNTGPIGLTGTWRFISGMQDRATVVDPTLVLAGTTDYSLFDLAASAEVMDAFEIFGGVNNLFDVAPQEIGGPSSTNLATFDVIGRTFFIGARVRY
ncbi:TonB-dependent receptor [Aurantiacibacter xanthus]|uniref:TonB-dependent receptor n=1 Tax=Aurantiacibacter xanthus TaxID=1784712 RepID=A0A3A1P0E2_9SPHN|nr:TonB-dependent receptor [Aurantiacibacter xanthus]RIV80149.1 TonB-dependent receptor [Aurantiacibacter xanthus]